jgi:hypothetical protein
MNSNCNPSDQNQLENDVIKDDLILCYISDRYEYSDLNLSLQEEKARFYNEKQYLRFLKALSLWKHKYGKSL